MKVALHSAPDGFFKSDPPHANSELFMLVRRADSWGFKCFQVGPLNAFANIEAERLRQLLDHYDMERNVHVGGLYDAERFAATEEEYERAQREIHYGVELCRKLSSALVSFHPPFCAAKDFRDKALLSKSRTRFLKLVEKEVEFASDNGVTMALESFCYRPFIFNGLDDFMQFVSHFRPAKLGVLLEVGHLFHAGFNLDEAISTFKNGLLDIHVHDATLGGDFRKATHLPIGSGSIDFSRLIAALRKVGYDGWLTLEIHGNERKIIESREYLENLVKK